MTKHEKKLLELLRPLVKKNAPSTEEECPGNFWTTVAMTKEQSDALRILLGMEPN